MYYKNKDISIFSCLTPIVVTHYRTNANLLFLVAVYIIFNQIQMYLFKHKRICLPFNYYF